MDISRVQQSSNDDCFPTCIEMLTGIDHELFNAADTPFCRWQLTRMHQTIKFDYQTFTAYRMLMNDLGWDMAVWTYKPNVPAIRVVNDATHAVVQLENGLYVDPAGFSVIYGESDLWVVLTETL